ncbi:MAG: VCBS repeat-containing protein [Planctomycetes bacterium]|nr:VCBS repeat-containing protein [Planctomycetota bacterium]
MARGRDRCVADATAVVGGPTFAAGFPPAWSVSRATRTAMAYDRVMSMLMLLLSVTAPQDPGHTDPTVRGEPAASAEPLRFTRRLLAVSPNEGCAIGDVDRDGRLDITAGPLWFRGPDCEARPLREVAEIDGGAYLANNGEHLVDVDGDGWLDVVSGTFFREELRWFRNPGGTALQRGLRWVGADLGKIGVANEITTVCDLDGDGVPEFLVNCWNDHAAVVVFRLRREEGAAPRLEPFVLGSRGHGHGIGWCDLDGDGDEDLVVKTCWYERPVGDPFAAPWRQHRFDDLGRASCPMVAYDFDGDGRDELVVGRAHGYGLDRLLPTMRDGELQLARQPIDASFSQAHALLLVDLLGDGRPGIVTGKRVRAHEGKDPGADDPTCLYYFRYDPAAARFVRHTIAAGDGVGTGLQIRSGDLDGDGALDLVVSGKTGTWLLLQRR